MASRCTNFSREVARACAGLVLCTALAQNAEPTPPSIVRIYPLGGRVGSEITVEILGDHLSNTTTVEFDCRDLIWLRTIESSAGRLKGVIRIADSAALGAHLLRAVTADGYSTSTIFNVSQFPSVLETEPNDSSVKAQSIETLPADVQGRLDGAVDIDVFAIRVRKGERKVFDLRSIEHGSAVEARMILSDEHGRRVEFNDDRDDFDENPLIEHTFDKEGTYFVTLDQYRGPRGFNFGKRSAYTLRISNSPRIQYVSPLGLRRGRVARIQVFGSSMTGIKGIYLTEARRAEYARMTLPYTMSIRFKPDPESSDQAGRITGVLVNRDKDNHDKNAIEVEFEVPADAPPGLWRPWVSDSEGTSEGPLLEISDWEELSETTNKQIDTRTNLIINGSLSQPGEKDVYRISASVGRPLHFWTLASQLGVPRLDSVLELRDAAGKKLVENDDVVAGQGSLIGNPDSSLFYTPKENGLLYLTVRDRVSRGGPDFQYRLKIANERPGFQLFTTPENFTVSQNGTSAIKVHLVREAGFEGEVSVWLEGLPAGIETPKGTFRADQLFEPNADGADMIIPEIAFSISVPATVAPGRYPIRLFGVAKSEEDRPDRRLVEGHGAVMIGPLLDLWNYSRRPAAEIAMTVIEPFAPQLISSQRSLRVSPGETVTWELKTESIPDAAPIRVANLPSGVTYEMAERRQDRMILSLKAAPESSAGAFEVSVEAQIGDRWAASGVIPLIIRPGSAKTAQ